MTNPVPGINRAMAQYWIDQALTELALIDKNNRQHDPVEFRLSQLHLIRNPDTWIKRKTLSSTASSTPTASVSPDLLFVVEVFLTVWRQLLSTHGDEIMPLETHVVKHMRLALWSQLILRREWSRSVSTEWVTQSEPIDMSHFTRHADSLWRWALCEASCDARSISPALRACIQPLDTSSLTPNDRVQVFVHLTLLATCPPSDVLLIIPRLEPKLYLYLLLAYLHRASDDICNGLHYGSYYADVYERLAVGEADAKDAQTLTEEPTPCHANVVKVIESGPEHGLYVDGRKYLPGDAIDVYHRSVWRNARIVSYSAHSSLWLYCTFLKHQFCITLTSDSMACLAIPGSRAIDHGPDFFVCFDVLPNVLLHPEMKRQWGPHLEHLKTMTTTNICQSEDWVTHSPTHVSHYRDVIFTKADKSSGATGGTTATPIRGVILFLYGVLRPGEKPHVFRGLFGYLNGPKDRMFFVYGGRENSIESVDECLIASAKEYGLELIAQDSKIQSSNNSTIVSTESSRYGGGRSGLSTVLCDGWITKCSCSEDEIIASPWPSFMHQNVHGLFGPLQDWLVDVQDFRGQWCSARLLNWHEKKGNESATTSSNSVTTLSKVEVRFLYWTLNNNEMISVDDAPTRIAPAGTRAMDHINRLLEHRYQLPNFMRSPYTKQFNFKSLLWCLSSRTEQWFQEAQLASIDEWIAWCQKTETWPSIVGSSTLAPSLPVDVCDLEAANRDGQKTWNAARLVYCPLIESVASQSGLEPYVMLIGYDHTKEDRPYALSLQIQGKAKHLSRHHEFCRAGLKTGTIWLTLDWVATQCKAPDMSKISQESIVDSSDEEDSFIDVKTHEDV